MTTRPEDGQELSVVHVHFGEGWRAVSSSLLGGGIGPCRWLLNAQVPADYHRVDAQAHLVELAGAVGCDGRGVGMLTAVDVSRHHLSADGGVEVLATVGLGWPTWAAASADRAASEGEPSIEIGTVNICVCVPAALSDGALVNVLATATEAKTQALLDEGVAGTGTASDAICVVALAGLEADGDGATLFGGPRSVWGARAARAVYEAVREGARDDWARAVAKGLPRPPRQG